MALFSNWQNAPKVVSSGRIVTYSAVPEYWNGGDVTVRIPIYWTITRTSRMVFSYLGMTMAAAETCAKAVRDDFTRRYLRWTPTVVEKAGSAPTVLINEDCAFECTSDIQAVHSEGDTWHVDASINETDTIVTAEEVTDVAQLEALFQLAEQREHPESGSIAVTAAAWHSEISGGVIQVDYSAIIPQFDYTKVTAEVKGANDTWTTAEKTAASDQKSGHIEFYSSTNATFRLRYNNGTIVSKEWTTKNRVTPSITAVSAEYQEFWTALSPSANFIPYHEYTKASIVATITDMAIGNATNANGFVFYLWDVNRRYEVRVESVTDMGGNQFLFKSVAIERCFLTGTPSAAIHWKSGDISSNSVSATKKNHITLGSVTCTSATTSGTDTIFSMSAPISSDLADSVLEQGMNVYCDTAENQIACTNVAYSMQSGVGTMTFNVTLPTSSGSYAAHFFAQSTAASLTSNFVQASWTRPKYITITSATMPGSVLNVALDTNFTDAELNSGMYLYYRWATSGEFGGSPVTNVSNGAFTLDFHVHHEPMQIYVKPTGATQSNIFNVTF